MLKHAADHDEVDVNRLFVLFSCHLSDLSRSAAEIEAALSEMLGDDVSLEIEHMQTLQKLDYLRQALEDSSALVDVLSRGTEVTHQELSDSVKLGVSRSLFSDEDAVSDAEAGMPDLF